MTNVAFAGLGRMGVPMAVNVARAGFPLRVWNRTPGPGAAVVAVGAEVAPDLAALACGADVLVTMVADAAAAEAVLLGPDGALAALAPGAVVVEMSTIGPQAARRLAAAAGERGVDLLDAPVSGSVTMAEAAKLTTMVGGPAEALERARPVLEAMTARQVHVGPSGTGAAMKLALNAVIALTNEAVGEALALAEATGIDRAVAYDVLASSAVASPFVQYKRDAYLDPEGAPVAFSVTLMQKDLALALALARDHAVPLPALAAAGEVLSLARRQGLGDADLSRVADVLRGDT
jgi:3-hydroxyisobutyrate dehydrogenase-like beta-hydroxyacid dehydrogenase